MHKNSIKKGSMKNPVMKENNMKRPVIAKKTNKLVERLKNFNSQHNEEISFIANFVAYTLIYGLAISYIVWGVFGTSVSLLAIPSWGILAYFVKEEMMKEVYNVISLIRKR